MNYQKIFLNKNKRKKHNEISLHDPVADRNGKPFSIEGWGSIFPRIYIVLKYSIELSFRKHNFQD